MNFKQIVNCVIQISVAMNVAFCAKKNNSIPAASSAQERAENFVDHAPVSVELTCPLLQGATFELHLNLNRKGIDEVSAAILAGSFIGEIANSPMELEPSITKRVNIRTQELARLAQCIQSSPSRKLEGSLTPISLIKMVTHESNGKQKSQTVKNFIELTLEQKIRSLNHLVEEKNWQKIYEKLGPLSYQMRMIQSSQAMGVAPKLYDELVMAKASMVSSGVLTCEGQWIDPKIVSIGDPLVVRVQKDLLNRSCFLPGSIEERIKLRALVLVTQIFTSPELLSPLTKSLQLDRIDLILDALSTINGQLMKNPDFSRLFARIRREISVTDVSDQMVETLFAEYFKLQGSSPTFSENGLQTINVASQLLRKFVMESKPQ